MCQDQIGQCNQSRWNPPTTLFITRSYEKHIGEKDLSIYEKADLCHQILQRYMDGRKSAAEIIELRVTYDNTTATNAC